MAAVVERDLGWAALRKAVQRLDGMAVKVGVLADSGMHTGETEGPALTVADVAARNEFGTERVPERSFIRAGVDEARERIGATTERLADGVIAGSITPDEAANRLGLLGQGIVQAKIVDGPFAPNAPRTIIEKGSSAPLIASGQMRQAVTYEVTDRASAEASSGRAGGVG